MPDAFLPAKCFCFLQFPDRERTGTGCDRDYMIAQYIMGYLQQKSGVNARGKSNGGAVQIFKLSFEQQQFFSRYG